MKLVSTKGDIRTTAFIAISSNGSYKVYNQLNNNNIWDNIKFIIRDMSKDEIKKG